MPLFEKILFPVDFSPSCVAMAPYVQRASAILRAKVSLIHVVDPGSFNSFALVTEPFSEISEDYLEIGRARLDSFLTEAFPTSQCARIVVPGDAAAEIARVGREGGFDLIIMPTRSGRFRQMLLGSTTAKVLNDADCPVLTSTHAETIAPRPLEHREWLCAIGLNPDSERVLRFASRAAAEAGAKISIIHAVAAGDADLPIQLDLKEEIRSAERERARQRLAELQTIVGCDVPVHTAAGSVKDALLGAARQFNADVLIVGRSAQPGSHGRMRDLTYTLVRDSPFPVVSV